MSWYNDIYFETANRSDFSDLRSGRYFVYAADGRISQHRDRDVAMTAARRATRAGRDAVRIYVVEA